MPSLPVADLDHCLDGVGRSAWDALRGKRLFITGATGIIGKWLLETAVEADRRYGLNMEVVALSRDPTRFAAEQPNLFAQPCLTFVCGDVRAFDPPRGELDFVIHAATDVVAPGGPLEVFDTCSQGTRRVLDFATSARARQVLLLSSGAVYGPQPNDLELMSESFSGGPDLTKPGSAYGEGKRVSEWLGAVYAAEHGLRVNVARVYALVGPYLPGDKHFAIGNFIADAMAGRPIRINGGGATVRSYLYLADVTTWLWKVLFYEGAETTFNVGSSQATTLSDLAGRIASVLGSSEGYEVLNREQVTGVRDRYVPDNTRARTLLQPPEPIDLDEAIVRTARWYAVQDDATSS